MLSYTLTNHVKLCSDAFGQVKDIRPNLVARTPPPYVIYFVNPIIEK